MRQFLLFLALFLSIPASSVAANDIRCLILNEAQLEDQRKHAIQLGAKWHAFAGEEARQIVARYNAADTPTNYSASRVIIISPPGEPWSSLWLELNDAFWCPMESAASPAFINEIIGKPIAGRGA